MLEGRKNEIYTKIQRIKEIDDTINNTGIFLVKNILNNNIANIKSNDLINSLQKDNEELLKEKEHLLIKHGYDKNFLENKYKCEDCKDTGYINNDKCYCYAQKLIKEFYTLSNLSTTLGNENFDTFDMRYYSKDIVGSEKSPYENMKDIFRKSMNFASNFDNSYDNLLYYGGTGLGKLFYVTVLQGNY